MFEAEGYAKYQMQGDEQMYDVYVKRRKRFHAFDFITLFMALVVASFCFGWLLGELLFELWHISF